MKTWQLWLILLSVNLGASLSAADESKSGSETAKRRDLRGFKVLVEPKGVDNDTLRFLRQRTSSPADNELYEVQRPTAIFEICHEVLTTTPEKRGIYSEVHRSTVADCRRTPCRLLNQIPGAKDAIQEFDAKQAGHIAKHKALEDRFKTHVAGTEKNRAEIVAMQKKVEERSKLLDKAHAAAAAKSCCEDPVTVGVVTAAVAVAGVVAYKSGKLDRCTIS